MSKNFKGFLGDQIGKLGTAVGRRWKGKMVYAAWQGKVRNPRTERQQLVRGRFALLNGLATRLFQVTFVGLKAYATERQMTEANGFIHLNYGAVEGNTPDALEVNYDELTVAKGPLTGVQFGTPSFGTPLEVSATIAASNLGQHLTAADDKVYLALYCPDLGVGLLSSGSAKRSDERVSVQVPTSWQGQNVHVYGFVVGDADGNRGVVANSSYLGIGTVA